ncbi:TraB/GumN family protein, partial [Pseudoalteromonas sp. S1688]|uniref:TraB/GumN family protein n=1 Tax=Pseudoalteromonas sp. S1688 TaxID=579511 RepID=UPI00110A7B4B
MNAFTKKVFSATVLLSICLLATTVKEQSSEWQLSKGNDSIYMGATVHILPKTEMTLPLQINHAYNQADTNVLEAPIPDPSDEQAQMKMLSALSYINNET